MLTLILAVALSANPIPEVVDAIDPDGDGFVTDAEFANACKTFHALNKSKKKDDRELIGKLDDNSDGKLGDDEILQLAAEAREHTDKMAQVIARVFRIIDKDYDGIIQRAEGTASLGVNIDADMLDKFRVADKNRDGNITYPECMGAGEASFGLEGQGEHPSKRKPKLWSSAVKTMKKYAGQDRRISRFSAKKDKALFDAFDEIDTGKDDRLSIAEVFNWLASQQ